MYNFSFDKKISLYGGVIRLYELHPFSCIFFYHKKNKKKFKNHMAIFLFDIKMCWKKWIWQRMHLNFSKYFSIEKHDPNWIWGKKKSNVYVRFQTIVFDGAEIHIAAQSKISKLKGVSDFSFL